jgi:phosphoglycerate dehydrogenase-like enzyme
MRAYIPDESLAEPGFADALKSVWPVSVVRLIESAQADVLISGRPSEELLRRVRPSALVIPFAGLPDATRTLLLTRPDLRCYNLHHNAKAVAETAVGMLLALSRQLAPHDIALRAGDWRPRYAVDTSFTLAGRVAVLLGWGAISRRIAPVLQALGMEVRAVRRRCVEPVMDAGVRVYSAADLAQALDGATAFIIAAPATPETEGLVCDAMLDRLGVDGIVINVGRASIVDEAALFERLENGRLFGAGLDVWPNVVPSAKADALRRTPGNFPFHTLANVVLSPHRSGHARSIPMERARALAELLSRLAAGEAVPAVDVVAGY